MSSAPANRPPPLAAAPQGTAAPAVTTGVPVLDDLIDGVRIGDNLVVVADDEAVLGLVARSFLAAVVGAPTVVVATDDAAVARTPTGADVLDLRAHDGRVGDLLRALAAADERLGAGAVYLIDSLSALERRWGADAAFELFLAVCPRLYRRRSVAMWLVDAAPDEAGFLARLHDITQVVLELTTSGDGIEAEVRVAAGRPPTTPGRRVALAVHDGLLVAAGSVRRGHGRLGELIRRQRLERDLSQSELARRVGISPSAVSQVERGTRGVGGETLMRIWDVLGVPFGPDDTVQRGYRIARRSGHRTVELADGANGLLLVDDAAVGEGWRIVFAAGARGGQPLFRGRVREAVLVDRGVLEVEVAGRRELLHEGDTLVVPRASIGAWSNPGSDDAVATWWVLV